MTNTTNNEMMKCAHPECQVKTDQGEADEGYWYGCRSYICEAHDRGGFHGPGHKPELHWKKTR